MAAYSNKSRGPPELESVRAVLTWTPTKTTHNSTEAGRAHELRMKQLELDLERERTEQLRLQLELARLTDRAPE
jgi:hypothetical protein